MLPITVLAECDNLLSYLNKKHPNRILSQNYGYTLEKLVLFEKKSKTTNSSLSVVECVKGKYKTQSTFKINEKSIAGLEFDEVAGTVIIIFSVEPPKTGFIEKKNGKYMLTYGLYEH